MTTPAQPISGLMLIDKPADPRITSMTVIRAVRRRLIAGGLGKFGPNGGTRRSIKVGHAGTLDPLASGLLIVLVGRATRLCDRMMAGGKAYLATIDLSRASTTDDLEGELTLNTITAPPTPQAVAAALPAFTGDIQQRPPIYSAIWVDGRRSYDLARAGTASELPARTVRIDSIDLVSYAFPLLTLDIRCGKGTYIRSLARDLGLALTGSPACLTALRRTRVEPYSVDDARPLESLPETLTLDDLLPAPPV